MAGSGAYRYAGGRWEKHVEAGVPLWALWGDGESLWLVGEAGGLIRLRLPPQASR